MKTNKWIIFIRERFDPLSHSLMILVFVIVHILFARNLFQIDISPLKILFLTSAVTLFYFKLRLYDEVKDYELDLKINPHRPLPRGLLTHKDMYKGMIICIILEVLFFSIQGPNAILSLTIAIIYSLLMYKEFYIKNIIRPHLTTYAISHTVVTSLLTIGIFSFLNQQTFVSNISNLDLLFFALVNWMLFNIFEFGRKTFALTEERPHIDTYSSLFGKKGAIFLVLSQAIIAFLLTIKIQVFHTPFIIYANALLLLLIVSAGIFYILSESIAPAKRYRTTSSVYIIIFYLILIVGLIL